MFRYLSYHNNDYTSIPVSKLSELSQKYNFSYIMQPLNYETVIYTFQFLDDNQDIKSTYKFAIEYNWED